MLAGVGFSIIGAATGARAVKDILAALSCASSKGKHCWTSFRSDGRDKAQSLQLGLRAPT